MAEGKLQPADSEESPLPGAEAPNFDLSDETAVVDGNGVGIEGGAETGAQGEPEGIFALFDREFPEGDREPIEAEESGEFDREFSESFETMFTAVRGDGSAPLFEPESSDPGPTAPNEKAEDSVLPIPKLEPEDLPKLKRQQGPPKEPIEEVALEDLPLAQAPEPEPEPLSLDDEDEPFPGSFGADLSMEPAELPQEAPEPLELDDFLSLDEPLANPLPESAPVEQDSEDELQGWDMDGDGLEELNFDDPEDEVLSEGNGDSEDDAAGFDDFAKLALGFGDEDEDDDDEVAEEDDFVLEDLSSAAELDPFEDIAIMSSEDVAKYEPAFGDEELQFRDQEPASEDPDPFAMDGAEPSSAEAEEEEFDPNGELDPFSEEAAALAGSAERKKGEEAADEGPEGSEEAEAKPEKKEKRAKSSGSGAGGSALSGIRGILMLPWKLYSLVTTVLFGLIEGAIGILAKIPLIGIPFRILGSVLSAIPMALKRVIVLLVIAAVAWGGTSVVTNLLPKPAYQVNLPDSGSASFTDVELKDGVVTGKIENTGDVTLQVFPQVQVSERKLLEPGTWFSPLDRGVCAGELVEVAIDATAKISYSCGIATDGAISVSPSLKE